MMTNTLLFFYLPFTLILIAKILCVFINESMNSLSSHFTTLSVVVCDSGGKTLFRFYFLTVLAG